MTTLIGVMVDMPCIMRLTPVHAHREAPKTAQYFTARVTRLFTADATIAQDHTGTMLSTVLVGFDGSDRGLDALALGRALTAPTGQIVVVCVSPANSPLVNSAKLAAEANAHTRFDAARSALDDDPRAVYVISRDSSIAAGLHAEAEERNADVLVVGSSHRGPIGRILVGSVTRQTMLATPCAVAIAPAGLHAGEVAPFARIGVAYNASPEAKDALRLAIDIARPIRAQLRIIDIADADQDGAGLPGVWLVPELAETVIAEAEEALSKAMAGIPDDVRAEGQNIRGTVVPELLAASKQLDLLILGSRNYGPVRRVLLGSVSGQVVEAAACPVLVVPRGLDAANADAVPAQAIEVGNADVRPGALALAPSPS
jgi:nucleotide-binding universal stress UspA family protein